MKNQEHERLWSVQPETSKTLDPSIDNPFICRYCGEMAATPVISRCGHISCWRCIRKEAQRGQQLLCSGCGEEVMSHDLRPLYISGEDHQHGYELRPRGKNSEPIRNPGGFVAQQTQTQPLYNNVEIERQVPGAMGLPSNFVLAFSDLSASPEVMESADQKSVSWITSKIQKCLLISLGAIMIGVILVFDRK